jgi:hypothetical protein
MIDRFRAHFYPDRLKRIEYQGIQISEKATKILERSLDPASRSEVLKFFKPLPQAYRQPFAMVDKIGRQPILKIEKGFSTYPTYTASITDYVIPFGFQPTDRVAGECGEIVRWFLYDLQESKTADRLMEQHVNIGIACGNSPLFFNNPKANHVWVSFRMKDRQGLIIDPSFGTILAEEEDHHYVTHSVDDYFTQVQKGLFRASRHTLHGWGNQLVIGGQCDEIGGEDAPHIRQLGLSKCAECTYGLGISTLEDQPFIAVSFPYGNKQELYWPAKSEGDDYLGVMSSHNQRLATENPLVREEIQLCIEKLNSFSLEIPAKDDERLRGLFFGYR